MCQKGGRNAVAVFGLKYTQMNVRQEPFLSNCKKDLFKKFLLAFFIASLPPLLHWLAALETRSWFFSRIAATFSLSHYVFQERGPTLRQTWNKRYTLRLVDVVEAISRLSYSSSSGRSNFCSNGITPRTSGAGDFSPWKVQKLCNTFHYSFGHE